MFGDGRLRSKHNTKKPYTCTCIQSLYATGNYIYMPSALLELCAKLFYIFVPLMIRLNSSCRFWTHYRFWHFKMHIYYCSCHTRICIQIVHIRAVKPIYNDLAVQLSAERSMFVWLYLQQIPNFSNKFQSGYGSDLPFRLNQIYIDLKIKQTVKSKEWNCISQAQIYALLNHLICTSAQSQDTLVSN